MGSADDVWDGADDASGHPPATPEHRGTARLSSSPGTSTSHPLQAGATPTRRRVWAQQAFSRGSPIRRMPGRSAAPTGESDAGDYPIGLGPIWEAGPSSLAFRPQKDTKHSDEIVDEDAVAEEGKDDGDADSVYPPSFAESQCE
jgi:hypothetical protein